MNTSNWIELAALLTTVLGGGSVGVSKLTRVAVAIETFGKALEDLGRAVQAITATGQGHETRLSLVEARLNTLEAQHAASVVVAAGPPAPLSRTTA